MTFPVAHSADPPALPDVTLGAFVDGEPAYLQFILFGARTPPAAWSSASTPQRRHRPPACPEDVAGLIRYLREHASSGKTS